MRLPVRVNHQQSFWPSLPKTLASSLVAFFGFQRNLYLAYLVASFISS